MPPLSINLTNELKAIAEARASESGHRSIDDYVSSLIRADADQELDPELEAQLLAALDSGPARELPPDFWDNLKQLARGNQRQEI